MKNLLAALTIVHQMGANFTPALDADDPVNLDEAKLETFLASHRFDFVFDEIVIVPSHNPAQRNREGTGSVEPTDNRHFRLARASFREIQAEFDGQVDPENDVEAAENFYLAHRL